MRSTARESACGATGTYDPTVSPEIDDLMNDTVAQLEALGATVIDPVSVPIEDAYGPEFAALLCEFKDDIASYLETYTDAGYPKTLQDLIDFNDANPDLEGPWNSEIFVQAEATGGRADPACVEARETADAIARASIDDTMAAFDLDAIVAPTNGPAWVTDPVNGDDLSAFVGSSSPSAIAGYPQITVPGGYVGPLPVGVSFLAGQWDEPTLIGFAYAFEQATAVRVPPQFLPTISATTSKAGNGKADKKSRPAASGPATRGMAATR